MVLHEIIGKKNCPIVDSWWQTETGGILISPLARNLLRTKTLLCNFSHLPGVVPVLVDDKRK